MNSPARCLGASPEVTLTLTVRDRWLIASFPETVRACSWAIVGGGFVDVQHVAWLEVRNGDLRPSVDPARMLTERLHARGLHFAVGLLTSANIAQYIDCTAEHGGVTARCLATVGLGNALRAGDPPWLACRVGTINTMVYVDTPLTDEALLEASAIATEAKCAAVLEAGVRSRLSDRPATGTGTDCTVVACARSNGRGAPYAGKHTAIGSVVGGAVESAIVEGVRRWNEAMR
ncbi:adenosylcobinamide amidohydrolase [Pendulispora rubella]|uniref:Adenosylcobinamide amidohydrolase n=1 Tax=Pendulispora rubella TaxID=2741070 RepID=A0ABZ2L895_9BACT